MTRSRSTRELTVAILCARSDSVYKTLVGCDVWDKERDALTFPGGMPVVAHPPCAQWGRLSHLARVNEAEKQLGPWCVEQVRRWGGVVEHPALSRLWNHCAMPRPGGRDAWGGVTVGVSQFWFGHQAEKKTWLYCCRVIVPPLPFRMGTPEYVIASSRLRSRPKVRRVDREHTPKMLAEWLVACARTVYGLTD